MKRINKKMMVLVAALLLLSVSLKAQIYIMDDEFEGELRQESDPNDWGIFVPEQGSDADQQYTPIGSGVLVLSALGGAYLLSKRKKTNN